MADAYTMYVDIIGLDEATFWERDIAFVQKAASNLSAYNKWIAEKQKEVRRRGRK